MKFLFESSDVLNAPFEGFYVDTSKESFSVKSHWHYFVEMIYMLKGNALIDLEGESQVATEGDFILFLPCAVHAIYATTSEPLTYAVIKFDLGRLATHTSYAPNLQTIFRSASHNETATKFFPVDALSNLSLKNFFIQTIKEITAKAYGYDIHVQAQLWTLFIEILRYWRKNGFDTDTVAQATTSTTEANSLHTITQYIDKHSHELLKVETLAELCHMSYSHFAKSFHQLYGQSCKQYIEFVRICKVEDFLLFTNFDLNYISQETGFSDCSHLIKTFKKLRGITPKQFRLERSISSQG